MSVKDDKNAQGGVGDTGHVWDDDLRDLLNPPPKWWLMGLYASGLFVLGYVLLYPAIPLISTHTKGIMGWTSMKEYKEGKLEIDQKRSAYEKRIHEMDVNAIAADKDLVNYISRSGKVLFGDNCAACHGTGGQGNPNFPVLADDDWLFGGSVETIQESISGGRGGVMTAHGATLTPQQIDDVAKHVVALSTGGQDAAGKAVFSSAGCTACHGDDAKGMAAMGSANLTDSVWRFSGNLDAVKYTITHGVNDASDPQTRVAQMPSFAAAGKLSADEIKKLAVYVHQLGGGK